MKLTTTAEDCMHMVTGHARLHDWIEATKTSDTLTWETPECLCDTEAINRQSRRHDQGREDRLHLDNSLFSLKASIGVPGTTEKMEQSDSNGDL